MLELKNNIEELKELVYNAIEEYDPMCALEVLTSISIEIYEAMLENAKEKRYFDGLNKKTN